ncbi:MAG TPA: uroporphyrinogen decarboxylase, partial [Thermodesulfobacteriota bacterium]|nr:uroporphyrinogen decarboxylase [Thermodesulfobacteriota bacterium]
MKIASIDSALYQIPLPIPLSDSTHGEIPSFELITVRIRDDQGLEGLGYTYTVGVAGGAIQVLIDRYLRPDLLGQDPSRLEYLWERMWWRLHYS